MKLLYLKLVFCLLFLSIKGYSQKLHYENSENASKMFKFKNYQRAKELYREIYKKDLTNDKNKYYLAVCMVYTYERTDAIKFLKDLSKKNKSPIEIFYHLANAYHLENRYDKAIDFYNKYINQGKDKNIITDAKRNIEMCQFAKKLINHPINVDFEHLDKKINSKGDDYLPYITPDETMLFFSTRREGTTGRIYDLEKYYPADIYTSKYKYGKWRNARSIGTPNSYGNEQTAGIAENGNYLFYYVNNPKSKNNLQIAEKGRRSFGRSVIIENDFINQKNSIQLSATISNHKDYLIFSSDRDGGFGGHDLYICKKLPNGKWGSPKNLGSKINTAYDECYPELKDNTKTLLFASKGHNSIGGFDIFISEIDLETFTFTSPKNFGYPINTPDDNLNICFIQNDKYAYISAYRNDSEGGLDIYKVNFKDNEPPLTIIKGFVLDTDSNTLKIPIKIEVFNKIGGDLYGLYEVNQKKGSYIMILPPNKYVLKIDVPKKGYFTKEFTVGSRNKYVKELTKNITVTFENSTTEQ